MKISIDRNFSDRKELDSFVKSRFGENPQNNKDISIEMDETELQKLSLSDKTTIHGVKIIKK